MTMLIPQREHFNGAERLSPAWTPHKAAKSAVCTVWSHQFGFELRLTLGAELLQSQVCRTQEKLIETQVVAQGARGEGLGQGMMPWWRSMRRRHSSC
jgi:hypothetical protein